MDFMQKIFSMKSLALAVGAIAFAAPGFAQTPQASGHSTTSSNTASQAQSDPVGATHSDGQSGKSSRPFERDVQMPSHLDQPPQ
jgi:hypothetical protein